MKRLILLIAGLFIFAACGSAATADAGSYGFSVVTIGPAITEVVVALGFEAEIVAHDSHSEGIPGLAPNLPQFDMMGLDAESLVALGPDMVFISSIVPGAADHSAILENAGITVVVAATADTIDGIYDFIDFIAGHLDAEAAAESIITEMQAEIAEITAIAQGINSRRTVYFEINPAPDMFTFGAGTFLHEVLELVGGINAFADHGAWVMISDEAVLAANPDVILTNVDWAGDDAANEIASRPGWGALDAVANSRIYVIDRDATSRANHNIVSAMWEMGRFIYPEYFR